MARGSGLCEARGHDSDYIQSAGELAASEELTSVRTREHGHIWESKEHRVKWGCSTGVKK